LTAIEVASDNVTFYSLDGVLFSKDKNLIQYPAGKQETSYAIPNSVTSIGNYAFYGCTGLTEVTIPNSVTSIGNYAFYGCTGLTEVTIPDSVTSIGAFYGCTGLMKVTIPNSVTSIGGFYGCTGLTEVTIPNLVTSIGERAFYGCTGLTEVTIPDLVTSIGRYAFYGCSGLTALTIGNSLTSIEWEVFSGCKGLMELTIPNSVTSIGRSAFYGCSGLTALTIPNSVTEIGWSAFSGCTGLKDIVLEDGTATLSFPVSSNSDKVFENCPVESVYLGRNISSYYSPFGNKTTLTSLTIGNSVTSIGYEAFSGCSGLTELTIPNSVTSIGNSVFSGCTGLIGTLTIPSSVTSIGYEAFSGCTGLTGTLTIPSSVTLIENYAFSGCTGLKNIVLEDGTALLSFGTTSSSLADKVFENCPVESVYLGRNISYYIYYSPFGNNTALTSLTVGNSVTSIGNSAGNSAFSGCTGLKDIVLKDGMATLFVSGSLYSPALESVYLGRNVPSGYLFANNTTLTSLTIGDSVTSIGNSAFSWCTGLTELTIPNSVTEIGERAFWNCTGLTELTIPNSVTEIGTYTFSGCTGLTGTLTIGNSVTSIGSNAFSGCTGLTELTIPNSVTSIGGYAFSDCTGLTALTIGDSVTEVGSSATSIGDYAFSGCAGLKTLAIGNSVTSIGNYAFSGCCTGLTGTLTIPHSVTSIGYAAFYGCTGLTGTLTIPHSVTSIENSTFYGCTGLTALTIWNSVTSIGSYAFSGCTGLKDIVLEDGAATLSFGTTTYSNSDKAFENCPVESVYLGRNISYYIITNSSSYSPFKNKTALTSLTIGNSVTSVGYSAFSDCTGLTALTISGSVTEIGRSAFSGCTGLKDIVLEDGTAALLFLDYEGAFKNSPVESVYLGRYIPDSLNYSHSPFKNNTALTSLTIGDSVTSIGNNAFYGCTGLTALTIGNSVTSIGNMAFYRCSELTALTIPGSVTEIGEHAFSTYTNLTEINSQNPTPPQVQSTTFYGVNKRNCTLYVPTGCTATYQDAPVWKDFLNIQEKDSTLQSNDCTLAGITVSAGTLLPAFNPDTTSYSVIVANGVTGITLSATAKHWAATVSGTGQKQLNIGANTFQILVTAQDGTTKKTYTVTVTRATTATVSNDCTLAGITVSAGALSSVFNPNTTSYSVNVANNVTSITLSATANHEFATVSGAGLKNLVVGSNNVFQILVTAQDGATKKTYTVTVTRAAATTAGNDCTLAGITVSTGALSPVFNPNTPNYFVNVANSVTGITLSATANHGAATVSGAGQKQLAVGVNTFQILVTAQDGTTRTYTVTVTRAAATTVSNDCTLAGIAVSTGTLSPAFNPNTTSYFVNAGSSVTGITLSATANHGAAAISGTGQKHLDIGTNVFQILVTAQDGATKTYTVTVTRAVATGIDDVTVNRLSVYPNPVKTSLFIKSELSVEKVEIYDLQGKQMVTGRIENGRSINVSRLPKGAYLFKVYTDKGVAVNKFVKE
jgi:hypothetical protein